MRLRTLALAALWLSAMSLAWVGGGLTLPILGAVIGSVGYWVGWRWRNKKSLAKSLTIASLVIGLSFFMRSQMLEAMTGNWLPLGQFLILVQAFASFDARSRGGIYSGIVLSGTVLFFASQQAFDQSFGVFIIVGFIVVLLAFLTLSFLEDSIRGAKVHWPSHKLGRPAMLPYWIGVSCAVFMLSGVAFWLMPKDELSLVGPDQLTVLPHSGDSLESSNQAPLIDPSQLIQLTDTQATDLTDRPDNSDGANLSRANQSRANQSGIDSAESNPSRNSETDRSGVGLSAQSRDETDSPLPRPILGNSVDVDGSGAASISNFQPGTEFEPVFYVRTKIASYWRGRTLHRFDGQSWDADSALTNLAPSRIRDGIWINRANINRSNRALYQQTFYIREGDPDATFTGYNSLSVEDLSGSLDGVGVESGATYRVLSAYPSHNPQRLRRDSTWAADRRFLETPPGFAKWLFPLAEQITDGAVNDFEKVERIVGFLRRDGGTFIPDWYQEATGTAQLQEFLIEGKPGDAMDYATATIMLARASGLPSRLAVGYLPGTRDPLSGAYQVRRRDAHTWGEIYFSNGGWIPFDSSPRGDLAAGGTAASGVGSLFNAGMGDAAFDAVKSTPSQLIGVVLSLLNNPALAIIVPSLFLVALVLRWLYFRQPSERRRTKIFGLYQSRLTGDGRREMLAIYRKLEKMLQKASGQRREAWQTVGRYAGQNGSMNTRAKSELAWFTRIVWRAAYDPEDLPEGSVSEAKTRLRQFKESLNNATKREHQ